MTEVCFSVSVDELKEYRNAYDTHGELKTSVQSLISYKYALLDNRFESKKHLGLQSQAKGLHRFLAEIAVVGGFEADT